MHGLVASLIALGDGQQTGSPQRAAHGNPGSKEGHDGVTQEADQVGTAGIEDNLLIGTIRGRLGNNFLRQYKVGKGDDVGRQSRGDRRQEEAPGREAQSEDGEVLQNIAEAQGGQTPLNLRQRDLVQQHGSQNDGEQLGRNYALVTHYIPETALGRLAGKAGVEQEEIGHQNSNGNGPGSLGHTGGEYVYRSRYAGAQYNTCLDAHWHGINKLASDTRCTHDEEAESNQHLQGDHCINTVNLSGRIVGQIPLLQELQGQGQRGGDPAGYYGVAQQRGQIVADCVQNTKGQSHQEYAVLIEAQGSDVCGVVQAKGGHRGGNAGAQAGNAQEHGGSHLGPGPLMVDQRDTDLEGADFDTGLFFPVSTLFQRELTGHKAFRYRNFLLGFGHVKIPPRYSFSCGNSSCGTAAHLSQSGGSFSAAYTVKRVSPRKRRYTPSPASNFDYIRQVSACKPPAGKFGRGVILKDFSLFTFPFGTFAVSGASQA